MHNQSPASVPTTDTEFVNHPLYASGSAESGGGADRGSRLAEVLRESGLTPEDVEGWSIVSAAEASRELGVTIHGEAVRIPYYDRDGNPILDRGVPFARFKLLDPTDKADGRKYMAPSGSGNHLYIPPGFTGRHESGNAWFPGTLFVTEGEKKAAAAAKAGYMCVGIPGVQQWADSLFRNEQKAKAELTGEDDPGLSEKTPVMPELAELIRDMKDAVGGELNILVLFDADGAPVERKHIKDAAGDLDPEFKLLEGTGTKKYVLNPSVYYAAQKLARALTRQFAVRGYACFVPHGSENRQISYAGKLVWSKRLTRRGLDDWLRESEAETIRSTLQTFVEQAQAVKKAVKIPKAPALNHDGVQISGEGGAERKRSLKILAKLKEEGKGGYIPLGYSVAEGHMASHFWSIPVNDILNAKTSDLRDQVWYKEAFGVEYCLERWHYTKQVGSKDDPEEIKVFDLQQAQDTIITETQEQGQWSRDNVFGAGVWSDGAGGLEINSKSGRFRVDCAGDIHSAERVMPVERGGRTKNLVFPTAKFGDVLDEVGTEQDVEEFVRQIHRWNYERSSDALLVAGWALAQAYTAAGPVRPNLFLTGPTSSGKTTLVELIRRFLGPWSWFINDASNASVHYIRRELGYDVATLFLDEAEPSKVKAGASKLAISRDHIAEVVRALRASYAMDMSVRGCETSPGDDEDDDREEGRVSAGGKATAGSGTRDERLLASALLSAISLPETDQADRDRMLVVNIQALSQEQKNLPPEKQPSIPRRLGGRVFRLMWERWGTYRENLEALRTRIEGRNPKAQLTPAACIAALITATGQTPDDPEVVQLVEMVNAERCRPDTAGDAAPQSDHDVILDSLLATPVDLDSAGTRGGTVALSDVIAHAINAGMGKPGRGGNGGRWGDALRLRGMVARRDDDTKCWGEKGQVWLFIARNHPEFKNFTSGMAFGDVYHILAQAPAARKGQRYRTQEGHEVDDRAALSVARRNRSSGVWVPVDVDPDAVDESSETIGGGDQNPLA